MLKRLHLYMLGKFAGPLVLTFLISIFLLLMQFLWKYIDELVGKGLETGVILELLFYASLTLVPLALPLSILLASLMTFGNLGEQYELFAMKSGGISLIRIMYPLVVLTAGIAVGAFFFTNNILPYTNLKMRSLLFSIQQQRPEINLQNGIFTEAVDGFSIKVENKDKNQVLHNIMIYDHRAKNGNKNVTTAESGSIKITSNKKHMILSLTNGTRYEELEFNPKNKQQSSTYPHQRVSFVQETMYIELDGLGLDRNNEDLFKNGFEMLNIRQLQSSIDSLSNCLLNRKRDIANNLLLYSMFKGKKNSNPESGQTPKITNAPIIVRKFDSLTQRNRSMAGIIKNEQEVKAVNFDSLYNSLSQSQKNKVVDFALNYSRSAETYISNTGDELEYSTKWIRRHSIEWHRKFTVALACIILFFVGAPLGAIIRKGGFGTPVVVSVFVFLLYYVVSITFEKMARELAITPFLGMWFSAFVMLPIGFYLTLKAMNDSLIVSNEQYNRLNNMFKFKRKFKKKGEQS
ncbi:MAG: LptF/LptG family permease [Bacteroidales bacterium]|nr:LptF/LptG family permease [Bacteroidales bacterium]HOY37734.1 LptF/LptG family permease [Bacteroidales bacterium]HQP04238.1 LptF/LptG family permease [Bacteroidales bacterium]